MYLFRLAFCPDVCPGMGSLDHMATLFLSFLRNFHIDSTVAEPTYFPGRWVRMIFFSVIFGKFKILHIFPPQLVHKKRKYVSI